MSSRPKSRLAPPPHHAQGGTSLRPCTCPERRAATRSPQTWSRVASRSRNQSDNNTGRGAARTSVRSRTHQFVPKSIFSLLRSQTSFETIGTTAVTSGN